MKVLLAIDSFKGSMSSEEVSNCLELGLKREDERIDVEKVIISDGGEGMVDAFVKNNHGTIHQCEITGPRGNRILGFYGVSKDEKTAYIEVAAAVGLYLLDEDERDPNKTTSYGVGELILDALDRGIERIVIGLGGSSTNDGGIGMALALGAKFISKDGSEIRGYGEELIKIEAIDSSGIDKRIREIEITAACDVDNPLTGERGATYVFSEQKGADFECRKSLEWGMLNYEEILNRDVENGIGELPGAGAAGGLGVAVVAYLNGQMKSGIELIIDECDIAKKIEECDLVVTGEGKIDKQSLSGKVPYGIGKVSNEKGKKVIAIAGKVDVNEEDRERFGLSDIICITPEGQDLNTAMERAKENTINICKYIFKEHI